MDSTFEVRDRAVASRDEEEEIEMPSNRTAAKATQDRSVMFRLAMVATALGLLLAVAV